MNVLLIEATSRAERRKRFPRRIHVYLCALMLTHLVLVSDCIVKNFVTFDEAMYIPSGISHWKTGDFSMGHVNPPLTRMIAVLPILLAQPVTASLNPWNAPGERAEPYAAQAFAFDNADRYMRFVAVARIAGIVWSLIGGYLAFRWARDLYGESPGLLAAGLWYLEPNVLAHASLATTDVPTAVAGAGACYILWRYLKSPSYSLAVVAGVILGVAQLTKFTLLLLYILLPLLAFLYWIGRPSSTYRSLGRLVLCGQWCIIIGMSIMVINIGYNFNNTMMPLRNYSFISSPLFDGVALEGDWKAGPLGLLPVPLPAEYLRGIDHQRREFEGGYWSYLCGEWRHRGWWYYYVYATALKVPLGYLALALFATLLSIRGLSGVHWTDEALALLPPLAIFALVSSQTGFSHHFRYVLPALPFAMVTTAKLARPSWGWMHWRGLFLAGMMCWGSASTILTHPHYLSYFNEVAGGPECGHACLINSNIDSGQDLLFLEQWLGEHPEASPLRLAYYNSVDPRIRGIKYLLPPTQSEGGPVPGFYAISVNFLRGTPWVVWDNRGWMRAVGMHEYEYFRCLRPIARAGYSIYIYRISKDDANTIRRQIAMSVARERPHIGN